MNLNDVWLLLSATTFLIAYFLDAPRWVLVFSIILLCAYIVVEMFGVKFFRSIYARFIGRKKKENKK